MFVIVEVLGVVGVCIMNVLGVKVDSNGYVVVLYLMLYSFNMVVFDLKGILMDVELKEISWQIVLCVGVVLFIWFVINIGCVVFVQVLQVDGMLLLFGVIVYDEMGKEIGVVF